MTTKYSKVRFKGNLTLNKIAGSTVVWDYPTHVGLGPYGSDENPSKDVDITFHAIAYNTLTPDLFYTVVVGTEPDGCTLDPLTGQMTGTLLAEDGIYKFTVRAALITDPTSYAEHEFNMVIGNPPPPIWVTPPGLIDLVNEETPYSFQFEAMDPSGLPVSYVVIGGTTPNGMSLDPTTGLWHGTLPDLEDDREYIFTVAATNGSKFTPQQFSLYVQITPPGDAATWITPAGEVASEYELTTFDFFFQAQDPNNLPISYIRVAGNIPEGLLLASATGEMAGTFEEQPNDTQFKMILGAKTTVYTTKRLFTITVKHVDPPVFGDPLDSGPIDLGSHLEDYPYSTNELEAKSATPLPLVYSIVGLPSTFAFNTANAYVSGIMPHNPQQQGDVTYNMTVSASNGIKSASKAVILKNQKNLPPVFYQDGGSMGIELGGKPFISYSPLATDPNGLPVTYTLLNPQDLPNTLQWDAATGSLQGVYPPAPTADVTVNLNIVAYDGVHSTTKFFTITSLFNTPPVWNTPAGLLAPTIENYAVSYQFEAEDPQGEPIQYFLIASNLPPSIQFKTATATLEGTAPPCSAPDFDTYSFTVRAFDGVLYTDRTFVLPITKNYPPIWDTEAGNILIAEAGKAFTVKVKATDPNNTTPTYYLNVPDITTIPQGTPVSYIQNGITISNDTITGKLPQPANGALYQDFNVFASVTDNVNPPVPRIFTLRSYKNTRPDWKMGHPLWKNNSSKPQYNSYYANAIAMPDSMANAVKYGYNDPNTAVMWFQSNGIANTIYAYRDGVIDEWFDYLPNLEIGLPDFSNVVLIDSYNEFGPNTTAYVYALTDKFEELAVNSSVFAEDTKYYVDQNTTNTILYWYSDGGTQIVPPHDPNTQPPSMNFNQQAGRLVGTYPKVVKDEVFFVPVTAYDHTEDVQQNRYYGRTQKFVNVIRFNAPPQWLTANALGRVEQLNYSLQLQAINNGNQPAIKYQLVGGTLPPNFTLTNTGVLAATLSTVQPPGKVPAVSGDQTYNFKVRADNGTKFSDRDFTFTIYENLPPEWQTPDSASGPFTQGLGQVPFNEQDNFTSYVYATDPNGAFDDALVYKLVDRGNVPSSVKFIPSDPLYSYQKSLLQFENTYTDEYDFVWDVHGTPSIVTAGKFGKSLGLDGASYLTTSALTNPYSADMTIDFWFKRGALNGQAQELFSFGEEGLNGINLFFTADNNRLRFEVNRSPLFTMNTSITDQNWHYLSLVRTSTTTPARWTLYIDGVASGTASAPAMNVMTANKIILGSYTDLAGGSSMFIGQIEDFRITAAARNGTTVPTEPVGKVITGAFTGNFPLMQANTNYTFTVSVQDNQTVVPRTFMMRNLADQDPMWSTPAGLLAHVVENEPVTLNVGASDPEENAIIYSVQSGNFPFNLDPATGHISGNAPAATSQAGDSYDFTLRASDGIHTSDRTFQVLVDYNFAPVWVTNSGLVASTIGGEFATSFKFEATDANNQELTYTITGGTPPTDFNLSTSGTMSGKAPIVQSDTDFTFEITVSDGVNVVPRSFTWRILINRVPVFSPPSGTVLLSKFEQTEITQPLRIGITDPDGSKLNLQYNFPSWMTYTVTGTGTPQANVTITGGTLPAVMSNTAVNFVITADDTVNFVQANYTINVLFNSPPLFVTGPSYMDAVEQTPYTANVTALSNGMPVFYSIAGGELPNGIEMDSANARLIGTGPLVDEDTTFNFTILATTGVKFTTQEASIIVRRNEPPVWVTQTLTPVIESTNLGAGIQIVANDPNPNQTLTFSWLGGTLPATMQYDLTGTPKKIILTGNTPVVANTTAYPFRVGVSDGFIRTEKDFVFTVLYNEPPVWDTDAGEILSIFEMTALPGNARIQAHDPENKAITYTMLQTPTPPAWLSLSQSGQLTGTTPKALTDTNFTFAASVSDGYRSTDRTFIIKVKHNTHPPVWTTPAGVLQTGYGGDLVNIQLQATDTYYTGVVTYAADPANPLPSTMSISSTGLLTGTLPPSGGNTQNFSFNIIASNSANEPSPRTFIVTSNKVNVLRATSPSGAQSLYGYDEKVTMAEVGEWTLEWLRDTQFSAKLWGAAGGGTNGGGGGFASGSHGTVALNSTWKAWVGGGGRLCTSNSTGYPGGFGGGGSSGRAGVALATAPGPASGGGLSGLFSSTTVSQATARIIAGGGGGGSGGGAGAAGTGSGGGGGGTTGTAGTATGNGREGLGGTQIAGGSVGNGNNNVGGQSGSALQGGRGSTNLTDSLSGSGGGGGWFGGGAGGGNNTFGGGGGGGSGYIGGVTSGVLTQGSIGAVANSSDPDYDGLAGKPIAVNASGATSAGGLIVMTLRDPSQSDANWSNVALLMNGSGSSDLSTNALAMSVVGGVDTASTVDAKYGNQSIYFPATTSGSGSGNPTSYIQSATLPSTYNIGNRDFTIEYWFKCLDYTAFNTDFVQTPIAIGGSSTVNTPVKMWLVHIGNNGTSSTATGQIGLYIHNGSTSISLTGSTVNVNLANNSWHHIAFVRKNRTLIAYANGISVGQIGSTGASPTVLYAGTDVIRMGGFLTQGFGYPFKGYLDDVRITLDVARYSTNFTPPSAAPTN